MSEEKPGYGNGHNGKKKMKENDTKKVLSKGKE